MTYEELQQRRRKSWCVDGERRVPDPEAAKTYIDRLGVVTLYNASSEVPNLYDAHMGMPNAPTDSKHDSPAGYVYTWRWDLGKAKAAYYGVLVAKRPTWVAWDVLPFVLGAFMERRHPEELHELGLHSSEALRIATALEKKGASMKTDELRKATGFPTCKENRNAYLKALEELESRMIVAKPFLPDGEMVHVLVENEYREAADEARKLDADEALTKLMKRILPEYIYVESKPLARALRIDDSRLVAALRDAGAKDVDSGRSPIWTLPG